MGPIPRREFLRIVGLGGVAAVAADRLLGPGGSSGLVSGVAAAAPDPIGDLAAALDYDVERIFRFVADEVRYEPYAGVLRGDRGTLAGRAGNSADQAALLAALLDASAVPTRFVTGRLDEAAADALMSGTVLDAGVAAQHATEARRISAGVANADRPPSDDPSLAAAVKRLPEIAEAARDAAAMQVEDAVTTIVDALAGAGIDVQGSFSTIPGPERDGHVWVQAVGGTDWVDLDPTPPAASPGQLIAVPTGEPMDALPDELRHRVALEVVAERLQGGALTRESLVSYEAAAEELAGVPIVLLHEKPAGLAALGIEVAGALSGTVAYQPVLQVGDSILVGLTGLSFSAGGGVLGDASAPGSAGAAEGEATGAAGAPGAAEGEATGEWLELRLTGPGGVSSTVRRTLFDRVGDRVRAAGVLDPAAVEPAPLVDLDDASREEYLPLRTVRFLAVATGTTSGDVIASADTMPDGSGLFTHSGHLYHLGRDAMAADLALPRGARSFIDAPSVVSYGLSTAPTSGDAAPVTASLDILARSFGHLPLGDVPVAVPPGIVSGVISHVAERIALGDGLPPDIAGVEPVASVGAVFDEARDSGVGLRVLRGQVPTDLDLPDAGATRLGELLGAGWVAIVPERPVRLGGRDRLGWWLVDPATGRTLDEMDDGGGAEMVKYTGTQATVPWRAIGAFARWGLCLGHWLHELHLVYELVTGQAALVYGLVLGILTHKLGHWACR